MKKLIEKSINWKNKLINGFIDVDTVRKYRDDEFFPWDNYLLYSNILSTEELLEEFIDKINWDIISSKRFKLSESFMEKHKDKLSWYNISNYQTLSEEFIEKHKDSVKWKGISMTQTLSEEFIEKNKDFVDWDDISSYQKLSEEFIERNKSLISWSHISERQVLSESFMEKHKTYIDWKIISKYQVLSEDFIKKHKNLINWNNILRWQPFINDEILKIISNSYTFKINDNNYLYYTYQATKEQGGFIGYIRVYKRDYNNLYRILMPRSFQGLIKTNIAPNYSNFDDYKIIKAIIKWEDLVSIFKVKKIIPLREYKLV